MPRKNRTYLNSILHSDRQLCNGRSCASSLLLLLIIHSAGGRPIHVIVRLGRKPLAWRSILLGRHVGRMLLSTAPVATTVRWVTSLLLWRRVIGVYTIWRAAERLDRRGCLLRQPHDIDTILLLLTLPPRWWWSSERLARLLLRHSVLRTPMWLRVGHATIVMRVIRLLHVIVLLLLLISSVVELWWASHAAHWRRRSTWLEATGAVASIGIPVRLWRRRARRESGRRLNERWLLLHVVTKGRRLLIWTELRRRRMRRTITVTTLLLAVVVVVVMHHTIPALLWHMGWWRGSSWAVHTSHILMRWMLLLPWLLLTIIIVAVIIVARGLVSSITMRVVVVVLVTRMVRGRLRRTILLLVRVLLLLGLGRSVASHITVEDALQRAQSEQTSKGRSNELGLTIKYEPKFRMD